jgi:putative peptidoglycan lipid II flippase
MIRGALHLFTGSLVGKILGVVREVLLAAAFGTTGPVAAYRVAQTATLAPVNFVSADTLSAGFVPVHARLLVTDARGAQVYYRAVRNLLMALSVAVTGVLLVWPHEVARLVAPGFSASLADLTASMLTILAIGIPLYLYTTLASYLEMSHGVYRIASVRASVQSIGLIAGVGAAVVTGSPLYLAGGFTLAYACLAAWAALRIHRADLAGRPAQVARGEWRSSYETLWAIMRPLLPLPFLLQGAIVIERMVATLVSTEAAAGLDYARVFSDTVVLLVATPLGLASLTAYANASAREVIERAGRVILPLFWAGAASAVALGFFGEPLVDLVLGRGAFGEDAIDVTTAFLVGLSVGLPFQLVAYFQAKVLNSQRRNREVLAVVGAGSAVMIAVDLALYQPLGAVGIGLGASAGALTQTLVASWRLRLYPALGLALAAAAPPLAASVSIELAGPALGFDGWVTALAHAAVWAASAILTPSLRGALRSALRR